MSHIKFPKPAKSIKVRVGGTTWTVKIYEDAVFRELPVGPDDEPDIFKTSSGVTDQDTLSIYLILSKLTPSLLRHELVHAYVDNLHLSSADLTADQMEEIFADFISLQIEQYLDVCRGCWDKINKWLEQRVRRKNEKSITKAKKAKAVHDKKNNGGTAKTTNEQALVPEQAVGIKV